VKAAELASNQLGNNLKNSKKWKVSLLKLNGNISLLLAILALSSSRFLSVVRSDLNKELPQ
jgi:hypothetical protein